MSYIPINRLSPAQQQDLKEHGVAAVDGELYQRWNIDRHGVQWLRSSTAARQIHAARGREIQAVPLEATPANSAIARMVEPSATVAVDSYDELLHAIFRGETVDEERGLELLAAECKTIDDFDDDLNELHSEATATLFAQYIDDEAEDDE